jgi:membrane-bound serine protease (ClpP class)
MVLADVLPESPDKIRGIQHTRLLGEEGIASSDLRPAGVVLLKGKRIDAVSEGEYITAKTKVRVVLVEGNRVVVIPID